MNNIWFKRFGWVYIPVHAMGLLVTFFSLVLNFIFFLQIDRRSQSASETFTVFFVYFTCVFFWWRWIAEKTS
jgi:hypothetical protein